MEEEEGRLGGHEIHKPHKHSHREREIHKPERRTRERTTQVRKRGLEKQVITLNVRTRRG